MIVHDFVMLGTTVPEPASDGRVFVCSAGVSAELGTLLRVYPLSRRNPPSRWSIYEVPLERPQPQQDSRVESWKILGDRSVDGHEDINKAFVKVGEKRKDDRPHLIDQHVRSSIAELNAARMSLGVIYPNDVEVYCVPNGDSPDSPQLKLFAHDDSEKQRLGAKRFGLIPRIRFTDDDGEHRLMLRDWGVFEMMRKEGETYTSKNLADALKIGPHSGLLVGNLANQRRAWLVIAVLNHVQTRQLSLAL